MSDPDPGKFPLWCWVDVLDSNRGCRFSLIAVSGEDQQTILQEGFNSIDEAISWGVRRMRKMEIDPVFVYTRVGHLVQNDEDYRHLHDIFDENASMVCKLMLE